MFDVILCLSDVRIPKNGCFYVDSKLSVRNKEKNPPLV
jgi:hypothetical protein